MECTRQGESIRKVVVLEMMADIWSDRQQTAAMVTLMDVRRLSRCWLHPDKNAPIVCSLVANIWHTINSLLAWAIGRQSEGNRISRENNWSRLFKFPQKEQEKHSKFSDEQPWSEKREHFGRKVCNFSRKCNPWRKRPIRRVFRLTKFETDKEQMNEQGNQLINQIEKVKCKD